MDSVSLGVIKKNSLPRRFLLEKNNKDGIKYIKNKVRKKLFLKIDRSK